jgi:hypothetical protein
VFSVRRGGAVPRLFARPGNRIKWSSSAEITFAGAAATKLVAAAGAEGVAVTVWGLRVYGVSGAEAANGMVCFGVLTYGVYAAAVAIAGFGLWFGLFSGPAPAGLTLVPLPSRPSSSSSPCRRCSPTAR